MRQRTICVAGRVPEEPGSCWLRDRVSPDPILVGIRKVRDDHAPMGKPGNDFQVATHRLDVGAKIGHVHVRAPFQLRDSRLLHVQGLANGLLGHGSGLPHLVKQHGSAKLRFPRVDQRPTPGRQFFRQSRKGMVSCHQMSPSFLSSFRCSSWMSSASGTNRS